MLFAKCLQSEGLGTKSGGLSDDEEVGDEQVDNEQVVKRGEIKKSGEVFDGSVKGVQREPPSPPPALPPFKNQSL